MEKPAQAVELPIVDGFHVSPAELAYGLLWHMALDTYMASDRLAQEARRTLAMSLGREGQARGIAAAKAWLAARGVRPHAPATRDTLFSSMLVFNVERRPGTAGGVK